MAAKTKSKKDIPLRIKPKSPEMEALLQAGYPFTIVEARRIVKEYEAGATHLMADAKQAAAMIAAYDNTAKVTTAVEPGWKRSRVPA